MNVRNVGLLALCLGLAAPLAAAEKAGHASLDLVSGPPEPCVRLMNIDHTSVVDEQDILFYMKGGEIYRNHLPYRCPRLGRNNEPFMYRASLDQLCNLDIITPMQYIGFGFSPNASCGLGKFYPVTKEDVAKLKERARAAKSK